MRRARSSRGRRRGVPRSKSTPRPGRRGACEALRQKGVSDADIDVGFETIFAANASTMKVNLYEDEEEDEDEANYLNEHLGASRRGADILTVAQKYWVSSKQARRFSGENKPSHRVASASWTRRALVIRDIVTVMKRTDERSEGGGRDLAAVSKIEL